MQRLIMPFKSQQMCSGYKHPRYLAYWKYDHYGVDISSIQGNVGSDHNIYASGSGTVVLAGLDNRVGNCVVVVYPDCGSQKMGKIGSLVARYMHLASIAVKAGQTVAAGAALGVEGNTGTTDPHLHLEFDTDIQYPAYSPQVAGGTLIKKSPAGYPDTTVNPSYVLHVGAGQTIAKPTYNPAWLNPEDHVIPSLTAAEPDYKGLYEKERDRADYFAGKLTALASEMAQR